MKRALIAAAVLLLAGCGSSTPAALAPVVDDDRIVVATTAYPLYEVVQTIGGNRVRVEQLLPTSALDNGALSGEDKVKLEDADLVVGLGLDTQPNVQEVTDLRGAPTLNVLAAQPTKESPSGGIDPYVWMDPTRMATIVEQIQGQLAALDPQADVAFEARAGTYRARLAKIDSQYAHALAGCSREQLVTEVPAFGYLADRYDLQQVVTSRTSNGTNIGQPFSTVQSTYEPTTVFTSKLPGSREARAILREDNVRIAVLDPLVNRTDQARRGGANYERVAKLNLDALEQALGCTDAFGGS